MSKDAKLDISIETALSMDKAIPLAEQVTSLIRKRIIDGTFMPGSRLPSEAKLTKICNVSRTTIRSSLATLTAEGLLERRWGDGTYVRQGKTIANPIDKALDFMELIANAGFEPSREIIISGSSIAGERIVKELQMQPGDKVLRIEQVIKGDADPLIYCVNFIPCAVLEGSPDELVTSGKAEEPLFDFIEKYCGEKVSHHIATLWADRPVNYPINMPACDEDEPILVMQSVGYNADEKPLFVSLSAYPDKRMQFQLMRRQ